MPAKFDTLRVAEITVNITDTPPTIKARAAFVSTKTGRTHGWTTAASGWSNDTMEKLRELRDCMERDMLFTHFGEDSLSPTTTSSGSLREDFKGLGEHLTDAGDKTPQG